jgi:beta-mannosidase
MRGSEPPFGAGALLLDSGWHCLSTPAGAVATPAGLPETGWIEAAVPGTVAGARRAAGLDASGDQHAQDHWFRLEVELPPGARLDCAGLATLAEAWVDDQLAARSESMFQPLQVNVPAGGGQRLHFCFRALRPRLERRGPGRPARWRGRLTESEHLRQVRTTMLGHMPGWHPPVMVVGPYRPVELRQTLIRTHLHATLHGKVGRLHLRLSGPGLAARQGALLALGHAAPLRPTGDGLAGTLDIPSPPLWWPHTHGPAERVAVHLELDGTEHALGAVGFRSLARRPGAGFGLVVNGERVFCRGALWSGTDTASLPQTEEALLPALRRARDAGFNMLRVPGFALYESDAFFAACDALGLLVWHDFMFARFDYPTDDAFLATARAEATAFLQRTASHPSLAVLCGGSEMRQAAAMAGRPQAEWAMPLIDSVLAEAAATLRPDIPYVANAPDDEALPFAAAASVAHYFGVGGYQRPPEDVQGAGVAFAAACLAFANPPDPASCRALEVLPGADPGWRQGVPRDLSASWDFEDVRDHYVALLFGRDPARLRREDPDSWLAHGRAALALLFEHCLASWRTDGHCAGALVLGFHDLKPGAGWGVLGHDGRPKSAWHALKRICQPLQIVLRDQGQNATVLHVINEGPSPRSVRIGLQGLDAAGITEDLGSVMQTLAPRSAVAVPALSLMGRFRDLGHAWRFGPAAFTVLGATLHDATHGTLLSEATLFPSGPALPPGEPGLAAAPFQDAHGTWHLRVTAGGFAQFVAIDDDCCVPEDDHFHLWPGQARDVAMTCRDGRAPFGTVRALNANTSVQYRAAA